MAALFFGAAIPVSAQDGGNVLLVVNTLSPDSKLIGARYAAARKLPGDNVLAINTQMADEIDRRTFDLEVERPISEWLTRHNAQDRILYIVLTKGIPLRVRGTAGVAGTVASVDSELTLLYRKLLGMSVVPAGRLENPYFRGDRPAAPGAEQPFSHRSHDIYLVTRLDAFSAEDALALIDRGLAPVREGFIVLDQKATVLGNAQGDQWLAEAAARLSSAGLSQQVRLESTSVVASGVKQVLGYYSWGSNDPALKRRRLDVGFVPGALAATFVSTDGRTLREPPPGWNLGSWNDRTSHFAGSPQSLMGDLIREGATGVAGHVAEPFLDGSIRPQILFPAYLSGANLAEAFYQAMPYLSWQTIVVGDPLCAPFRGTRLSSDDLTPGTDPDTDLPRFFSERRVAVLSKYGARPDTAKLMLKAHARLVRGDVSGGREALEAVTKIEPTLNAAHFVLAGLYERDGLFDRAVERYRTMLTTTPDDVRALNNLAYILAVEKNAPQEALALAERAYRLASGRTVSIDLGYAMMVRRGTPLGALPFSEQAFDVRSIFAQIGDTLGWSHFLLGNVTEAERYLHEAAAGAPESAEIQLHLAIFESSRGRPSAASAALQKALSLDPSLEKRADVKELRSTLKQR